MQYYAPFNAIGTRVMPDNLSQNDSHMPPSGRGAGWVVAQVGLFGLFVATLFAGDGVPDLPGIVFAQIVGVIVALGAAAFSIWAFRYHGSNLTPFPRPVEGMGLIEEGPYRYVRHPMYTSIIFFSLGVGLAYANAATMLSSVVFVVFFMAKSGHEEDMLVAEVPGYRQYRSDVPWRLIPYLL